MADISKITIETGTYDIKDATARNAISKITNRKYVFIGDSYDAQVDPSDPTSIKWWSTVIVEVLGLTANDYIRSSRGGAAFGRIDNSFSSLLEVLTADDDVTDVLIAGGYNDIDSSYTDINNGMWNCQSQIDSKFPNARVHVAFIGNTRNSTNKAILKEVNQKYIQSANTLGWHYINNAEYSMQDYTSSFLSDGVHPSVYGATLIGRNLAKGLIYNCADIQYENMDMSGHSSYTDGDGNCDSFAPGAFKVFTKNGNTQLVAQSLSIFGFLNNTTYTPNGSNEIVLGTFENGYITGAGDLCEIPVTGRATDGSTRYAIAGNLKIKNRRLYISFLVTETSDYHYFSNLSQIVLNQFSCTLPTEVC